MSRYRKYQKVKNDLDYYSKQLDARDVKLIRQYRPRPFGPLPEDIQRTLTNRVETWSIETKLYKLSQKYYGSPDLWWVIGYYNNKPTDANWTPGDEVIIPLPVNRILKALGL
jgi:hypothetical protein